MTAANPSVPASFLRLECALDPAIRRLAVAVAALGGVVLLIVMAITCVSVTGRALLFLGLGAVPGDFELVELGSAFVVFCFMPWCQYRRGHVTVDLFVAATGPRVLAVLAVIGNILITLAYALIAWRLWDGMIDKMSFGQSSFILQIPIWWGYAASMPSAAAAVAVSAFTVLRSLNEALGGGETGQDGHLHE